MIPVTRVLFHGRTYIAHRSCGHGHGSLPERTEVSGTGITRVITTVIPVQNLTRGGAKNKTTQGYHHKAYRTWYAATGILHTTTVVV